MIYIVDDDSYVRRGFKMLLKSADYECIAYESVEDFNKSCKPGKKDLLILDMHMQGMNGCDLLMHFMKREFKMPVIIVTAYDSEMARGCAKNYGVVAFLRKPVDGEALLDLVRFEYNKQLDIH